jgi:MFS family permease
MVAAHRYAVLAIGTLAQAATCVFLYGLASLVPILRSDFHLSLAQSGALVSAPVLGLLLTLVLWGVAADRVGERLVLAVGLTGSGIALCVAPAAHSAVSLGALLAVAGASAGSVNAASGRVILGYFGVAERGTAMGVRQAAQPLGVALGGAVLPVLALRHGVGGALLFPAIGCLVGAAAVLLFVADPPRPARATAGRGGSPYADGMLVRVHAASALLVVPQFATGAFAVAFLVEQFGWSDVAAGRLAAAVALCGAAGRIAVGRWSDRVGSRLRPLRLIALTTAASSALLSVGALSNIEALAVAALVVATAVSSTPNGLAFTAVAEKAGAAWAGRALGFQNTGQNLTAVLVPPVLGALVGASSFGAAFAVAAVIPLAGAVIAPVDREHRFATAGPGVQVPEEVSASRPATAGRPRPPCPGPR